MAPTPKKKITAAETKKKKVKAKGLEIGETGTEMFGGVITEEYNPKLSDIKGIAIYDEMRKSDGTVKSAILSVTLPILRAQWFIKPGTDDAQGEEIAEFVEKALFEWQSITWANLLRQALLCLSFGVMPFEKVFDVRTHNGRDYIVWQKFSPRLPKTIQSWETSTGEPGIQQRKVDGGLVDIPMEKLCVFVNEQEGDNWWGTSILRAAYKHWYFKNTFYKIDAIAFERQGLGVPYVKLPDNYTEDDRAKAEIILRNMRANEQAFIIEPADYEIGFKDMMARTLRDPSPSIQHHNREIVKSVLAQFLELGATDSGSRALSTDQTDLFLQSLEAVAENIADTFNTYAIPQLVDLNFDNVEDYPKLAFGSIARTDVKVLADAYKVLVDSGVLMPTDDDEEHFRDMLKLPDRKEGAEDTARVSKKATKQEEEDALADAGLDEFSEQVKKKIYPERKDINAAIKRSLSDTSPGAAMARIKGSIALIHDVADRSQHKKFFSVVKAELTQELARIRRECFADTNDFKGYRVLTFAEKKVDFNALQKTMDRLESEMDEATRALLNAERKKYMDKITRAALAGDTDKIKQATFEVERAYAKIIKDKMKEAYEYGKNNASLEMGVKAPANVKALLDQMDIQADAIAKQHIGEITNQASIDYVAALNKGESTATALAAADAAMAKLIDELTRDTSQIVMAGYINTGRDTAFQSNAENIYALQRSEILDGRTCNYCLSVDGRIVEKTDSFAKNTIFHSGCRGIWVEILLDEEELPAIGGIPKSLRDRFGDAVNDLIQPRVPQTKKDSLARKEAERRLKRQQKDS